MSRDQHIQAMMVALTRAIEVSLAAGEAARAAVTELLKGGGRVRRFSQGDGLGPTLTLTTEDREFLSALSIRPEDH